VENNNKKSVASENESEETKRTAFARGGDTSPRSSSSNNNNSKMGYVKHSIQKVFGGDSGSSSSSISSHNSEKNSTDSVELGGGPGGTSASEKNQVQDTSMVGLSERTEDRNDDMDETQHSSEEFVVCAICLAIYRTGDEISESANSRCNHQFHRQCIEQWLLQHDNCPCCRKIYLVDVDGEESEARRSIVAEYEAVVSLFLGD
jgi:hypothetical protein